MPLNVDIPLQYGFVSGIDGKDTVYECTIHAARSRAGKVMCFHVHLKCGAHYSLVPICKIRHKPNFEAAVVEQEWDCFSDDVECHVFEHFRFRRVINKSGKRGEYICTFDWRANPYSDMAQEFKQGHLIKMDDGHYGIFPNNELLWKDKTWTGLDVKWGDHLPKLTRQDEEDYFSAENPR